MENIDYESVDGIHTYHDNRVNQLKIPLNEAPII